MITALAGGVGSARFLAGLLEVVDPRDVVSVGNTGDDDWFHGLRVCPDLDSVTYALAGANNPMLMVGGGAMRAVGEVRELAALLQSPVVPFRSGRGIVPDDDPLGFTCACGAALWEETDVVVGIGSRLELLFHLFRLRTQPRFDVLAVLWGFGPPMRTIAKYTRARRKIYLDGRFADAYPEWPGISPA